MPRYADLLAQVRERILDGSLPAGARLPTELELARSHQMSRGTVRQALDALVREGLIDRTQGRGTYVRQPAAALTGDPANRRIGLVLPYIQDQLMLDIMVGVERAVKSRGYQVSFAYADERMDQQSGDIARLLADKAQGLIIFPITDVTYDESVWRLKQDGVPFVLIDRYFPDLDCDYVCVDNAGGGYRATEHLLILGHTRIGFFYVTHPEMRTTSVRDRWLGYSKALASYNRPYDPALVLCDPSASDLLDEWLLQPDRPTAVFTVHDQEALHVLQAAKRCGLRIPEDLALVGFDDLSYAPHLTPPLTTVMQPRMDIGMRAGNLLINRIEGQRGPSQQIALPTSLVVRESCGARLRVHTLNQNRET